MRGEPYRFSHLSFISRAYHLSEEEVLLAHASTRRQPKSKEIRPATSEQQQERPRDRVYSRMILFLRDPPRSLPFLWKTPDADVHLYDTSPTKRGKEVFGLDVKGQMMLVTLVEAKGEESGALSRLVGCRNGGVRRGMRGLGCRLLCGLVILGGWGTGCVERVY